jgi:hypothetical protein
MSILGHGRGRDLNLSLDLATAGWNIGRPSGGGDAVQEEVSSPLVREASVLLHRAVQAIGEAKEHKVRRERVVWTDALIGDEQLLRDKLRDTVAAIAGLERAKGMPPEKVLMLLKGLVLDADAEKLDVGAARSLTDDVVRWGIEAYYAA